MRMGKAPLCIPVAAISTGRWQGINTANPHLHLQTYSRYVKDAQIKRDYSNGSDFRHQNLAMVTLGIFVQ